MFIAYLDIESQLPGWVGVCGFKGALSHRAFVLSGPVCPELSDTNVSSALERAKGSSLDYLHHLGQY